MMINLQPCPILSSGLLCRPHMAAYIQHRKVFEYTRSIKHKIIKTAFTFTLFFSRASATDAIGIPDLSHAGAYRFFSHAHLSHHSECASPEHGKHFAATASDSLSVAHLAV